MCIKEIYSKKRSQKQLKYLRMSLLKFQVVLEIKDLPDAN